MVLAGELKSQIDRIWNDFWSGEISNPREVMEQLTYLLFIKRLDDLQTLEYAFVSVGLGATKGRLLRARSSDT